jgi:hypothetical protein
MEGFIDKIDVKAEHQLLIDLHYRLELLHFIQRVLHKGSENCNLDEDLNLQVFRFDSELL